MSKGIGFAVDACFAQRTAPGQGWQAVGHWCAGDAPQSHNPPALRQTQYDKTARRWYLPKLLYWLTFSMEDTVRREVVR
jgi:hypothetical protein